MRLSDLLTPEQAAALTSSVPDTPTLDNLPEGGAWLPPKRPMRAALAPEEAWPLANQREPAGPATARHVDPPTAWRVASRTFRASDPDHPPHDREPAHP